MAYVVSKFDEEGNRVRERLAAAKRNWQTKSSAFHNKYCRNKARNFGIGITVRSRIAQQLCIALENGTRKFLCIICFAM